MTETKTMTVGTKVGVVTVTVYTSELDGAPVVEIDTTFEPDEKDMRVYLNDAVATEWEV